MQPFRFTSRSYLHFDRSLGKSAAEALATDEVRVARHSFYPFIEYVIRSQKVGKKPDGAVFLKPHKERPIAYAGHGDSHIYAHYASMLSSLYEDLLPSLNLEQSVTGFRSLQSKRNIHFANDIFEFIKSAGACAVAALDVSDFFGTLNHQILKQQWARLLNVARLSDDHFAVFQAITRYAKVDRERLHLALGLNPGFARPQNGRLCEPAVFREKVMKSGLISANRKDHGIPQGSPISAILSNVYMLDFDTEVQRFVSAHGGIYRRYCDDVMIVLPAVALRDEALTKIGNLLTSLKLVAHPQKTETFEFISQGNRLVTANGKYLNYLGFTFDGLHKRIRPASVARFYKNMKKGVRRARTVRYQVEKNTGVARTPLRRKQLHLRYSYLGRHNFPSYAFQAARIMKDDGIKRQVKAHWKRLQNLINEV